MVACDTESSRITILVKSGHPYKDARQRRGILQRIKALRQGFF
tara:strand:+ start:48 stop:176 length:129 start_codon:yes stop_codon:yes gene_type:complete